MFFNQQWQPGMSDSACGRSTRLGKLRERFFLAAHQLDFFEKVSHIIANILLFLIDNRHPVYCILR
jgi:hypothetical protein